MQDTTPEFRRLVSEKYRRLAPEERVRICTEMFDSARTLVEASLPGGLAEAECRRLVCERFYGKRFARAFAGRAASAG